MSDLNERAIETLQKFVECKVVELLYPENQEIHHTMDILVLADDEFLDCVTNIAINENAGGTSMVEIQVPWFTSKGGFTYRKADHLIASRQVGFRAVEGRGDYFSLKFDLKRPRMYVEPGVRA
jgi:hypothetical protein